MEYFVRYGEIGIKSPKIRHKFEKRLMDNIKSELECEFENNQGRLTLKTEETSRCTLKSVWNSIIQSNNTNNNR